MRWLLLSLTFALALHATTAAAQSAPAWGTSSAIALAPPAEIAPAPTHHVVRERLLIAGVTMLSIGYVASVVWGSYYLGSTHLGPLDCNDQYAGWHFIPVVGPVLGMVSGASCIHDNLHFEEGLFPLVFSAVQLAGLLMTIIGALGHDVPDEPAFFVSFDANGGLATLRGSF